MNYKRYKPFPKVEIENRTWPDAEISEAPVWCSVDLRDGNQALPTPMDIDKKKRMFNTLVVMGFKEIEVGFPSASNIEFQFIRSLIEEGMIPDDVTIQVLVQAREHLIKRTFEALGGVKRAIVHLYNSTSPIQREVVFKRSADEIKAIAVQGTEWVQQYQEQCQIPELILEYSPESFSGTELEVAVDICNAVIRTWSGSPIIINLPATVEMSTPNVYADQVEWMCRNIEDRERCVISVHTHNDRGTAVAAAELAVMAGAQRVEGTLFGNGERTGNLDIVTMAMNMFSQGIDPKLDFSAVNDLKSMYMDCTELPVSPRHPYVGEFVFAAFSGSHQDAINKGLDAIKNSDSDVWEVPYLPIDPADVGREYEPVIRINSQSGKGGIAFVLEQDYGFVLPKAMRPQVAEAVQRVSEEKQVELTPKEIYQTFKTGFIDIKSPFELIEAHFSEQDDPDNRYVVTGKIVVNGDMHDFQGAGNGPVNAFAKGIRKATSCTFKVTSYAEHALMQGADADAVAYVQITTDSGCFWGAGISSHIGLATLKATVSALNQGQIL